MKRISLFACLFVLGCGTAPSVATDATFATVAGDAGGGDLSCGDGVCAESESCVSCAADCGACPACGDGTCSSEAETCADCPADCGACAACGDGACADPETCLSCPSDCGACPACGDGTCDPESETCEDCAADCGACPVDLCGDGRCDPAAGEDCSSCAADCDECPHCGDGACEAAEAETCKSCPADCGACKSCGDGTCAAASETCSTCPADCGACNPCGDGKCDGAGEDCKSCPADCGTCAPKGCLQGGFTAYHGNLHSHTRYSDGVETPGDAFAHARKAGLDYLWVTDHMGQMGPGQWQGCKDQADTHNAPGAFVAGCGYEWVVNDLSGKAVGHFNLLFTESKLSVPKGLADLYDTLSKCPGCLGQWNHPPWPGTFGAYQFHAAGKAQQRLIEFSGRGTWQEKTDAYFLALRNGWKVSPSMNEDNHQANWGDSKRATGVWARSLDRAALREAILEHRTFATEDDTATVSLKAEGVCWMGSTLKGAGDVELTVVARDRQASDGFRRIELLGTDGKALATKACNGANPCTAKFSRSPKAATHWVAQAVQADGDRLVSAPLWSQP